MPKDETAPLFITGTWRCGSTLISRMMNNHPDLDITYDTVHFMRFAYNQYDPIESVENVIKLVSDINERIAIRYNLRFFENEVLDDLDGNYTYSTIYDAIMRNLLLKQSGKKIWGEKTNLAWGKIPHFLELFPKGRVIHLIRDPRAVLASWKRFTHAPGNDYLDSIINSYDSMKKALEYSQKYSTQRHTFLTYEHLVSNPEQAMQELCEKIDIKYDMQMLDDSKFEDMLGNQWSNNTIYNEKLNGISNAMINRWRIALEDWEIVITELVIGNLLEKFGYEKAGVKKDEPLIDHAISEVLKSDLTSSGLIRLLLTKEGMERYPADPRDQSNWAITLKKKVSL